MFSHLDKDGARKNKYQPAATVAAHIEQWSYTVRSKDQRLFNIVAFCFLVVHCKNNNVNVAHMELHVTSVTQAVFIPSACNWGVSTIS